MKIEEAKAMQGTEFIYVYADGDEIPAFVKKFDPEVGLTCMSLEAETRDGYRGHPPTTRKTAPTA